MRSVLSQTYGAVHQRTCLVRQYEDDLSVMVVWNKRTSQPAILILGNLNMSFCHRTKIDTEIVPQLPPRISHLIDRVISSHLHPLLYIYPLLSTNNNRSHNVSEHHFSGVLVGFLPGKCRGGKSAFLRTNRSRLVRKGL